MIQFFTDGGFPMWIILFGGLAAAAAAAVSRRDGRSEVLRGGAFFCLLAGVLGMAAGMVAVSHGAPQYEDTAHAVAIGLGELANNGILGAGLAFALWIGSVATKNSGAPA